MADHPFKITIPLSDLDCKNQNMISPAKEELVNFTNKLNNTVFMGGLIFAGLIMFWFLQSRSENGIVILNGWSAISISISGYLGITALNIFVSIWRTAYDKRDAK